MSLIRKLVAAALMAISSAAAIPFSNTAAADFVKNWGNPRTLPSRKPEGYFPVKRFREQPGGGQASEDADCQQFSCWGMKEATGGFHFLPDRERAREEWERIKKEGSCKQAEFPLNEDGSLAPEYSLIDYLIKNKLVSTTGNTWYWNRQSGLPKNADDIRARIPELRPGDILEIDFGSERHSMTVVEVGPDGKVYVGGRNPKENRLDLCSRIQSNPEVLGMRMLHIPDKLGNCEQVQYTLTCDSTFKVMGVRHMWTCCWHENLAGQAPLTTKRSAYACLSWSENRGTTWDTLITPRLTFAGCSAVVMRQETYSSLLHGSNRTIEVRGSTNDGATWPHLIGSDSLTEASLPWATNQRNVRIAWIYKGPVQSGRYWCVDEIKFFAKPSRAHDMSVSEITSPRGVLTQGPDVTPTAYLWNHGCAGLESALVTMTIGVGYTNSRWVRLLAHSDTVLDFPQWTAVPGTYTATCYVALDGDECRANDTATLTFRVVADTWVTKYPVYAGGTWLCACMTAARNCLTLAGGGSIIRQRKVLVIAAHDRAAPAHHAREPACPAGQAGSDRHASIQLGGQDA